jgi:23S rRNA pseudouridine1911/1915/1917 synthase
MLHAYFLGFIHPRTGRRMRFEAPRPEDFRDALTALKLEREG